MATTLKVTVRGSDVAKIMRAAADHSETVLARAVNAAAEATIAAMIPVLTKQTGLPPGTIHRALKLTKATSGTLTATISSAGGDIRLKYFGPFETPAGVSAAPHGARRVFAHTFMRAGFWPTRVDKPNWNGQVFERAGGVTKTGKAKFKVARSGEFIPLEMVQGASAATFEVVSTAELAVAVDHVIAGLLSGSGK